MCTGTGQSPAWKQRQKKGQGAASGSAVAGASQQQRRCGGGPLGGSGREGGWGGQAGGQAALGMARMGGRTPGACLWVGNRQLQPPNNSLERRASHSPQKMEIKLSPPLCHLTHNLHSLALPPSPPLQYPTHYTHMQLQQPAGLRCSQSASQPACLVASQTVWLAVIGDGSPLACALLHASNPPVPAAPPLPALPSDHLNHTHYYEQ